MPMSTILDQEEGLKIERERKDLVILFSANSHPDEPVALRR